MQLKHTALTTDTLSRFEGLVGNHTFTTEEAADVEHLAYVANMGKDTKENAWLHFVELMTKYHPSFNLAILDKVQGIIDRICATSARSAWNKGVHNYAIRLLWDIQERVVAHDLTPADVTAATLEYAMLNGAKDWKHPNDSFKAWGVYSWGGSALIYDRDIAEQLCTPSELKRTHNGERRPNTREEWLDVQARALYQAARLIVSVTAEMEA